MVSSYSRPQSRDDLSPFRHSRAAHVLFFRAASHRLFPVIDHHHNKKAALAPSPLRMCTRFIGGLPSFLVLFSCHADTFFIPHSDSGKPIYNGISRRDACREDGE